LYAEGNWGTIGELSEMTQIHERPEDGVAVAGMDLAEIKTLMLLKDMDSRDMEKILDMTGVKNLDELDWLTAKNLLLYLQSL
jgi:hypothetical protein